jgi:hypothetical protein
MKNALRALVLIVALMPGFAAAQTFPTVPDNTVIGRIGTGAGSGASQAIPFATLFSRFSGVQPANTVYAGPASGGSSIATFRALIGSDLPAATSTTLGAVKGTTCSPSMWFNTLAGGVLGCSQPDLSNLTGTLPALSSTFTQTGTGAAQITLDGFLRGKIYTPEMFGATPSPYGTAAGSVANNQTQVQNAINALAAAGGGTLLINGVYGIGAGITAGSNITFRGVGIHSSTFLYQPTGVGAAVTFTAGAGIVSNCGFYNMSIATADTTLQKNALVLRDVSRCNVDNIMISAYPTGNWTGTGGTGNGIVTLGRELTNVSNYQIYADSPVVFSNNPNVAGGTEDLDSWHFWNGNLVGPLTSAITHIYTVGSGVVPFNLHIDGYQDWAGGLDGFNMVATTSSAAFGIYLDGIKDEQAGASGGYSVDIAPSGGAYSVHVSNSLIGVRNAIFLQRVNQAFVNSVTYDPSGSSSKIGLNADITNSSITFSGNTWVSGTLTTLGAFTNSAWITPTGFATTLPATGVSYH